MNPKKWTIRKLLEVTTEYLKERGIDSPRLSAEILLAHQLKVDRIKLYVSFDQPLNDYELDGYRSLIRRRLDREPIQYITGKQEFWSIDFDVDKRVLIPRPESEILVEQVSLLYRQSPKKTDKVKTILDLGTGSGALAVSIAKETKDAAIWASDISEDALSVAASNSKKHKLDKMIQFVFGDLWSPIKTLGLTFDFIVSNPPYISSVDYRSLPPEIREYEPRQALEGYENGMFFIEKIIMDGADFLNHGGWLLIEMDPEQIEAALILMEDTGNYIEKKCIKDYSHRNRVVMAKKGQKKQL